MRMGLLRLPGLPKPFMLIRPTLTSLRRDVEALTCDNAQWAILDSDFNFVEGSGAGEWPPIENTAAFVVSVSRYATWA